LLALLGVAVVEPQASPRFQICCGAAGGMPQSKPEASRRMADARLSEYVERGAEAVITASPLCASHLSSSANGGGPAVYGLYGFIAAHFETTSGRDGDGHAMERT
jgi:Fe-S oxidoreductase